MYVCDVTIIPSQPPTSIAEITTTLAELMWKHGGCCLLRPVRVEQSEKEDWAFSEQL